MVFWQCIGEFELKKNTSTYNTWENRFMLNCGDLELEQKGDRKGKQNFKLLEGESRGV